MRSWLAFAVLSDVLFRWSEYIVFIIVQRGNLALSTCIVITEMIVRTLHSLSDSPNGHIGTIR